MVQADGNVDLGFAGDVYVSGLTLAEAEERIAVQLNDAARRQDTKPSKPYRVSVRLATGQSKYYYVLGTVATQGKFKANANDTVLDAILQAGLKSNSLPEKAYLVRPHPLGGHDQVYKIDWFGIRDRGDTLTNYQVFPGDRVVVPGTKPPGLISSLLGELRSARSRPAVMTRTSARSETRRRRRCRRSRSFAARCGSVASR